MNRLAATPMATMQQSDNADDSKSANRLRSNVYAEEGNAADLVTADYDYDNYNDGLGAEESGMYDYYDYSLGTEEKDTYDYYYYGLGADEDGMYDYSYQSLGAEEEDTYEYYDYGLGSDGGCSEIHPGVSEGGIPSHRKDKEDILRQSTACSGIKKVESKGGRQKKKPHSKTKKPTNQKGHGSKHPSKNTKGKKQGHSKSR